VKAFDWRHEHLSVAKISNPALLVCEADVSDQEGHGNLVTWTAESFPPLNVLVNNAGISISSASATGPPELPTLAKRCDKSLRAHTAQYYAHPTRKLK
jgi:short-subunit dehydrogenase involved in D-alanine esterification of teichoic acids